MNTRDLTAIQSGVLNYMLKQHETTSWWPTYREILAHFGWSSTNAVAQVMDALEFKGYVERRPNRGYRVLP